MCRKRKVVPGRATGGSPEEGGGEVETTKSSIRTERRWTVRVQINAGKHSFFFFRLIVVIFSLLWSSLIILTMIIIVLGSGGRRQLGLVRAG